MHKNTLFIVASLVVLSALTYTSNVYARRKLTEQERKFYAQNNIIFTYPCENESDCSSSSTSSEGEVGGGEEGSPVSGPEGVDVSKEVFKPCPTDQVSSSTHSGNYYTYTSGGVTYNVANTALDLDSYIKYLNRRHIAQDGKTCDPLTGKCYHNSSLSCDKDEYCDWGHCLHFATVFAGNLSRGECTSTDYGAANYAGAISQADPHKNEDESNKLLTLQVIYDAIMSGKVAVVKVASGTSRHFVVAVGIRAGANRSSLVDSDMLVLDTNGQLKNTRVLFFQAGKGGYWVKVA